MESTRERTPRLDWVGLLRRTFALDAFDCSWCGGRSRVLAYLMAPGGGAPFWSTWHCPPGLRSWPRHSVHPRARGVEPKHPQSPGSPRPCGLPSEWAAWAACAPRGWHSLCSSPAHSLRVTLQRPFLAPPHQPAALNTAPIHSILHHCLYRSQGHAVLVRRQWRGATPTLGETIGNGHAQDKHAEDFEEIDIGAENLPQFIDGVIQAAQETDERAIALPDERTAYIDHKTEPL
ncbi:hypothetical protein SAMN04488504_12047 [Myxococcus virescens]|uniref:Uncharacterized protein n=1 Tax=Myxococcus virescens TaxID=83456 RepID=A0ABY0N7X4_9BACT|nr:hypothetical protein SAMN04488504_12047 [Myxococcus virescens]